MTDEPTRTVTDGSRSDEHKPAPSEAVIDPVFARNPREADQLKEKHILIVGLGSGGSALALMAARAGVGRFTLIDPDELALENIGRHMLSRESVGQPKVKALKRAIKAVNPQAQVHAIAKDFRAVRPVEMFNGRKPDLLIGATDSFGCESMLNSLSLTEEIPAIYAGCWGEASVGEILYVIPGKTPCFECFARFRKDTAPLPVDDPRKYTDPDYDGTRVPSQAGLWPNLLIICGIAFQIILGLLDPEGDRGRDLIDCEHTLWLANVSAYDSPLQPLAVTFARVEKGCAVCDESKLAELGKELAKEVSTPLSHTQDTEQLR
jgi:molybdopterin/thiamine biosynthesis adenylyltransferase